MSAKRLRKGQLLASLGARVVTVAAVVAVKTGAAVVAAVVFSALVLPAAKVRLPLYLRGKRGEVIACHHHVKPDVAGVGVQHAKAGERGVEAGRKLVNVEGLVRIVWRGIGVEIVASAERKEQITPGIDMVVVEAESGVKVTLIVGALAGTDTSIGAIAEKGRRQEAEVLKWIEREESLKRTGKGKS